jgi:hypothetical protein
MCVILLGAALKIPVTVDRIEGEYAVVEFPGQTLADIDLELLPKPREGEKFEIQIHACGSIRISRLKAMKK